VIGSRPLPAPLEAILPGVATRSDLLKLDLRATLALVAVVVAPVLAVLTLAYRRRVFWFAACIASETCALELGWT
jgi:hypothetical protein